jgi:hypothetical protein
MNVRRCSLALVIVGVLSAWPAPAMAQTGPLVPLLNCAQVVGDHAVYHFGYRNPTSQTIEAIPGTDPNFFLPFPPERGQPSQYLPGEHHNVFAITFPAAEQLTWFLQGNIVTTNNPLPASCQNRYKCYSVTGAKVNETVALLDQFDAHFGRAARETAVVKPAFVCNPVEVTRPAMATEPATTIPAFAPSVHLACYTVLETKPKNEPKPPLPRVQVDNELGDDQLLRVAQPKMLCVPSTKTIVP